MSYLSNIENVTKEDAASLIRSEKSYGDSWKKRGGVGAFMMLARKWDRLEKAMISETLLSSDVDAYDIFERTECDGREEGIIDDIRDLRRYLVLVESELIARSSKCLD